MATKSTTFSKLFTKTLQVQNRVVSTSATNHQAIALTDVAPLTVRPELTSYKIMFPYFTFHLLRRNSTFEKSY